MVRNFIQPTCLKTTSKRHPVFRWLPRRLQMVMSILDHMFYFFWGGEMGVEPKIGEHPKMDGENNGKPYEQMDDLGVPLFLETPRWWCNLWWQLVQIDPSGCSVQLFRDGCLFWPVIRASFSSQKWEFSVLNEPLVKFCKLLGVWMRCLVLWPYAHGDHVVTYKLDSHVIWHSMFGKWYMESDLFGTLGSSVGSSDCWQIPEIVLDLVEDHLH